ncbi:MAG: efflux RND transporter periplasmic adaptor subunit [Alphaproteobacteria bacterium]|nr:efflux RND transporter periplasmic adaptor subunit [Alphaproteobacteria bacterium]
MKKINLIIALLIMTFTLPALATEQYTCPMHPHYLSDHEGTCPICGMDLVPVYEESNSEGNASGAVTISPETIQTMGVRTAKAEKASFGTEIRAVGIVASDKRAQQELTTRVEGWIEDLKIEAVGDVVAKGDVLYHLYSPELISAQKDYISALSTGITGRITATRKRLEFMGVQPSVLATITKQRKALENLPFTADAAGTVSQIMVREGSYIKSGEMIAQIEDYSNVWVEASVAEKDMAFIAADAEAKVRFPNLNNKTIMAIVDYIYPTIDATTRIGKIRLLLPNEGDIRPGMYADVVFETKSEQRLSIPTEAILHDADGEHVIVALGNGRFAPRDIEIGIAGGGRTEVLSGLKEGENIVVSSQFLIDSESSLRESLNKMQSPTKEAPAEPMQMEGGHARH